MAFFFQTSDALFATSKASCIIKPILDRSLHASNSARVPNYLSTDNPTNNKRCCQANEPKHQDSFGEFFYEVTKERHSLRAASLLSLNVLRFESDLCTLNRLWNEAWIEANFYRLCILLNRSMALLRRRNGKCEFSTLLFAHRLITCFSEQPSSLAAAPQDPNLSVTISLGDP